MENQSCNQESITAHRNLYFGETESYKIDVNLNQSRISRTDRNIFFKPFLTLIRQYQTLSRICEKHKGLSQEKNNFQLLHPKYSQV